MRGVSCERVLRLLPLHCDGELDVPVQLQVRAHLARCESCRLEAEALEDVGAALRKASAAHLETSRDEIAAVHNGVLVRVAGEGQPLLRRVARSFDDLHLLWIAAAATTAAALCVAVALGVGRLTLREVPYSMSAVIGALASPGSNSNPISVHARVLLPRANGEAVLPARLMGAESLYPLSAVVTQEGEVRNVSLLMSEAELGVSADISALLDAAAQVRFEPAREAGGSPVAVNVVWLLAHTTVVGSQDAVVVPLPRMHSVPRSRTSSIPISRVHHRGTTRNA